MNKYHIRFNTRHNGSDLVWRVFENGQEHLATDVRLIGETKWNIACYGRLVWVDQTAVIVTGKD